MDLQEKTNQVLEQISSNSLFDGMEISTNFHHSGEGSTIHAYGFHLTKDWRATKAAFEKMGWSVMPNNAQLWIDK